MLFNSYEFIFLFLPIAVIGFYLIGKISYSLSKGFLIIMSLFFYGYFNFNYVFLILGSIIVNYLLVRIMQKSCVTHPTKKCLFIFGVVFNLGIIFYYKYYDFFISSMNFAFATDFNLLHIILPLGISFFTFQQISFVTDSYFGMIKTINFMDYLLYVTFFPQLIAGPIVLHSEMLPQIAAQDKILLKYENISKGITWFTIGLFKKVVIADYLSKYVAIMYRDTGSLSTVDAWIGSFSYTLQLYFDFSAYSEMAIGLGLLFNFRLPQNFRNPYKATSINEFWKRWHITLSRFLKNYLYISLGGNRNGRQKTNILITMLLGGLWHGAAWTFVLWGGIHGCYICLNHLWNKMGYKMHKWLSWLITINAVNFAWIFFRAPSFQDAYQVVLSMFNWQNLGTFSTSIYGRANHQIIIIVVILLGISMLEYDKDNLVDKQYKILPLVLGIMFVYTVLNMDKVSEFLYFQF